MRHSLGQDILNNMFLFFLIIIAELQELPPVCVASLMDVLYLQISCKQFVFTDPAFYQANRMKILTDNYSAFSPKDPARAFYRVGCKASSKEF